MRGWDNGALDKCCLDDERACTTYASAALCKNALATADCSVCDGGVADSVLGCPQWADSAQVSLSNCTDTSGAAAVRVLSEFALPGGAAAPAVVQAPLGLGRIILLLVDDAPALQASHGRRSHFHEHVQPPCILMENH